MKPKQWILYQTYGLVKVKGLGNRVRSEPRARWFWVCVAPNGTTLIESKRFSNKTDAVDNLEAVANISPPVIARLRRRMFVDPRKTEYQVTDIEGMAHEAKVIADHERRMRKTLAKMI